MQNPLCNLTPDLSTVSIKFSIGEVEDYAALGKRIRQARETAGLLQTELAEKVGLESGTSISLIESGSRKPSVGALNRIAQATKTDVSYLIGADTPNVRGTLRAEGLSLKDVAVIENIIELMKKGDDGGNASGPARRR